MKTTSTILAFLCISLLGFSQTNTLTLIQKMSDCAPVTQRLIQANYSPEEQLSLEKDSRKLAKLNYVMAQSYRFADNQMVLRSQRQLFDAKAYESYRKKDRRVTVFDSLTGLYVELFSWNEMDVQFSQIDIQYDVASK
ncbi:hypothetical protein [Fluviicola taffensis]|uniref:Uncharacterized protein n=1 Tax=Fluviicola taffensis (strain DSM 16823 / NCIMB 13979 / RW262) TaxID=755732 RepID=F2IDV7_FLUTR|nr:hypothetical protein [Fluviicola taffensis]AEA44499.1 hypothetical protein Fluta_2514 [Fluviicola taffensis DSM 16823]